MIVEPLRIAAVVVLYNPDGDVAGNIASFAGQVARVYAVDNSEPPREEIEDLLARLGNVVYMPQRGNSGVATALNIGAAMAIGDGFDLLLTMDQDSRAAPDMVGRMLDCLAGRERVGIVSPYHASEFEPKPPAGGCEEVLTAMTSGNLLDLSVFLKVGRFMDEFFIDYVDDEYCLRLNAAGYKVLRCNDAILEHRLGRISEHRYHGRNVRVANQEPLRRYYMTRNRFHVMEKYRERFPDYCRGQLVNLRGEIKGIILFEERKVQKLLNTAIGYLDYLRGRTGRFRETRKRSGDEQ